MSFLDYANACYVVLTNLINLSKSKFIALQSYLVYASMITFPNIEYNSSDCQSTFAAILMSFLFYAVSCSTALVLYLKETFKFQQNQSGCLAGIYSFIHSYVTVEHGSYNLKTLGSGENSISKIQGEIGDFH